MKIRFFLLSILCAPVWADGPQYSFSDPQLNNEMINIYKDIKYGPKRSNTIIGTLTNDSAATGHVGEYVESVVGLTNFPASGYGDITSISLTAGDWDLTVVGIIKRNGSTYQEWDLGIGNASGTSTSGLVDGSSLVFDIFTAAGTTKLYTPVCIANYRVSLSGSATRYLKGNTDATAALLQFVGRMSARRVR